MPRSTPSLRRLPGLHVLAVLAAAAGLAGCGDDDDSPTETGAGGECSSSPSVGAVCARTAAETGSIRLSGGTEGAEYLYVPFSAARTGSAQLAVEVEGSGARPPTGPPNPNRLPAARDAATDFHLALRQREKREVEAWLAASTPQARSAMLARRQVTPAVPTVGQEISLNTATSCNRQDRRTGRVAAVSQRAIILLDVANPAGGFTDADAVAFAERFDNFVYPVAQRNFGEPADIDNNGRSIIFFTRAVNELTEANSGSFVGGFFWAGDLIPQTQQPGNTLGTCPGSNFGEVFYMLAPDPAGAVNGNRFSLDFVRTRTVGTLGHEFQHLINASRRLYINRTNSLEDVWLNEGLSHIAEELLFYQASGLSPRSNISLQSIRASPVALQSLNELGISNLGRYIEYLENPQNESLLGMDNLATRGAAWAFLRYAADHEPGADDEFFRRLVNNRPTGLANLQSVLGTDPIDVMQRWTVSVYTDDAVPNIDALYTQPSWNFRSLLPALTSDNVFPLRVEQLSTARTFSLLGGGAAYVRFRVDPSGSVTLRTTSGGATPPTNLRVSIVRVR